MKAAAHHFVGVNEMVCWPEQSFARDADEILEA